MTSTINITGSWANIDGVWAVRVIGCSGSTGDWVTVVTKGGKSSKVRLGAQVAPGVFDVHGAPPRAKKPIGQTSKSGFEVVTCTRCGGTGHFSYCPMYGTKCFRCSGSGMAYTGRGFKAHEFFLRSLEIPAREFQPGMLIRDDGTMKWHPIVEVKIEGDRCILEAQGYAMHCAPDTMVRRGWDAAGKAERLKAAIEYQSTL